MCALRDFVYAGELPGMVTNLKDIVYQNKDVVSRVVVDALVGRDPAGNRRGIPVRTFSRASPWEYPSRNVSHAGGGIADGSHMSPSGAKKL